MPVKIAIVDDKPSNRNILRDKLQSHALFSISFLAVDGEDFLQKMKLLDEAYFPEIVLMDLEMPNMDGVAAIAAGSALYPSVKFVVLTIFDDEEKIFTAIKAGASGYLLKDESSATIQDTLWQMHEIGSGPISPGIAGKILTLLQKGPTVPEPNDAVNNFFSLSPRELEILRLLANGLGYKEIGVNLFISVNTAKKHVINIYQKLHVSGKAQALKLAYEKGLI
jgi:DNA-binding NarL/FixJ family response regulator